MNNTPRTDAEVFLLFKTGDDEGVSAEFARKLERENAALRAELLEEARVNGKGGEREAKLLAEVAKLQGCIDRFGAANDLLLAEKKALRNEVARLNNQTMWVCSCGGTDCAGQQENAALRAALDCIAGNCGERSPVTLTEAQEEARDALAFSKETQL